MKLSINITIAAVLTATGTMATPTGKANEAIVKDDNCWISCPWPLSWSCPGWYGYKCKDDGSFDWDKFNQNCNDYCICSCETLPEKY